FLVPENPRKPPNTKNQPIWRKKNFFRKNLEFGQKWVKGGTLLEKNFFFSKLADFWYTGVFGHEKSIGASPEFQKNFFDPLRVPHIKKINFFNFIILAPNWLIFGIRGFSATRNRLE